MSSASPERLEKAEIIFLNGNNEGTTLECKFNPNSCTIEKEVNYGKLKATGSGASIQQFVNGNAKRLLMELFFDTTDKVGTNASEKEIDVREQYTNYIDLLLSVDGELHAPPVCRFVWGKGIDFTGLVESAKTNFTKFRPSGVPVRARVPIVFTEYKTADFHKSKVKPESTDKTKVWTVSEEDELWTIASEEYSDVSHWRTIADHNDLDNPRDIEPGQKLELPPL